MPAAKPPRRVPARAAAALAALIVGAGVAHLAGCTSAYTRAMREEMSLAPADLLALRTEQARDGMLGARDALLHLDDALRQLTLVPFEEAELTQADLRRRSEQVEAAAWEARRRMRSVHDVAPEYFAPPAPPAPGASPGAVPVRAGAMEARDRYADLSDALDAADRSLDRLMHPLRADLPTLPSVSGPGAADAFRAVVEAAIIDLERAVEASDDLLAAVRAPR